MRERKTTDIHLKRRARRTLLAAMVVAASTPAIAIDAVPGNLRTVPPLPLSASGPTGPILANPFCEPEPERESAADQVIRLAAEHVPAVRLRPIGAAVGLRSIGDPDAPAPLMTIATPAPAAVQENPLIGSTHHDDTDLSEVEVTEANLPPVAEPPAVPTIEAAAPTIEAAEPTGEALAGSMAESAEPIIEQESEALAAPMPERTKAISFSLSDLDTPPRHEQPEPSPPSASMSPTVRPAPSKLDDVASDAPVDPSVEAPIVASEPLVPIEFAEAPALSLQPSPHHNNSASRGPATSTPSPVAGIVSSSHRYRPPVAVTPPPLAFVRTEAKDVAIVRPAVTRVEAIDLSTSDPLANRGAEGKPMGGALTIPPDASLTALYMTKAQVRSLTIGGAVRQVAVDDCEICQAISAGPNEVKLIGTGNGVTRLAVWADAGSGGEPKVRVFQIHVEDGVDATGGSVGDKTDTLNQSIARAFPACRVLVRQESGQLVVAGLCDSTRSADQIIRMVRKTCLIPVVDELQIR